MPNHKPKNTLAARRERMKATPVPKEAGVLMQKARAAQRKKRARRLKARKLMLMRQQRKLEMAAGNLGSRMPAYVVRALIRHAEDTCPGFDPDMCFTDNAKMRVGEIAGEVLDELLHHCARTMKATGWAELRGKLVYTVAQTAGLTPLCHIINSDDNGGKRCPDWMDGGAKNVYPPWLGADFYVNKVELEEDAAAAAAAAAGVAHSV
jgi:hypothetical protein